MTIEKEAEAPQVQESDSDTEKKFRLVDAQWLRAQRSAVNGEVELKVFQDKLTDAATSFQNSQGHGVGVGVPRRLTAPGICCAMSGVQIRGSQYFNWLPLLIASVLRIRRNGIQIGFRIFYIS